MGSAVTSHFIGKVFASLGYYVFNYRDYPSLIRGGHNFNVLKISDRPVYSHSNQYDIVLALDQKTIDLHRKNLTKSGRIVKAETFESILKKIGGPKILENDILIGYLFKLFGIDLKILLAAAEKEFGKKSDLIKKAIEEGYKLAKTKEKLKKTSKGKYFISGNEGIALGALAAGMDIHFAYPMTPASPVLHFLAKRQLADNTLVFQPENEIAVVNMALGASFAGAKAMVGTSGGGFALMTEAFSMAGMAELPLVVYLAQRTAPSSGVPTYTGQGDLKFALNAGHGEFPRIVVAPGDPKDCIIRTQEAFYLSCKYRTPAIILGDKHLGESSYTFDRLEKSILLPKQKPVFRVNSYEHRQDGHTTEDPQWIVKMNDRRLKKIKLISAEIKKLKPVTVFGEGQNLIVSWGSTRGAIMDALPKLKKFRFLQISYLSPFPKELVSRELKKSKKIILVENNATGLLGDVIAEQTGFMIKDKVLKYDARPFVPEDIIKKLKNEARRSKN